MSTTNRLDVIVRLHEARRLTELKRAVFSLVGQSYRPLHVILCMQRFTRGMMLDVRESLMPVLGIDDELTVELRNYEQPEPADARSALANLGLDAAAGRYLAFLDYDDTLYPEAYAFVTDALRASGAVVAFAGITVKYAELEDEIPFVQSKRRIWAGRSLIDQFRDNCCPLHSFVIDRVRLPRDLRFETALCRLEDYDFLLRLCAACRSDFSLIETVIGDYYFKSDGSNTTPFGDAATQESLDAWERARAAIALRRRTTFVAPDVQVAAGLEAPVPDLTIQSLLELQSSPQACAA